MFESTDSQENTTETDSATRPFCKNCKGMWANKPFQFPDIKSIRLPTHPSFTVPEEWSSEPHDYSSKMRRRSRTFKPVLARIFEKDNYSVPEKEVKYNDLWQNKELRLTTFNKHHRLCAGVFHNDVKFVSSLLSMGVTPNCFDGKRRTPLHIAVSRGDCEMAELLLDKGADPNVKDGLGNSCLHLAACTQNVAMCLILIVAGASVDTVDMRGRSPLDLAQSKLRLLLYQYPDVLARSKYIEIVEILSLFLNKKLEQDNSQNDLLTTFQSRLQIANDPEQISNELSSLGKILNQMESLTINSK